ncbi:MAG: 1,4-dihydroxy-2-naphthoate octaprenyltransferase [Candidatus Omnitrophica bacterium CG1_02_40_15]|nr:MAG: 1,4-dihydroxy-2-naphthoate octaprenyltransferase [Candidatus Omnitrophica bacterium CG1_02_40_15]
MISFKSLIGRLKIWIKVARLPFLTATFIPVFLGTAIGWSEAKRFDLVTFFMALVGASLLHLAVNLCNDYFDHVTRNDWLNKTPTPFSGGSRVIQEGMISPKGILAFSLACFTAGSLIGLWLNHRMGTNVILFLGITGVFLGFFYTALPLKIGYRGFGEMVVGFCFGPLVVMGSYYVQAMKFSWAAFWASVPIGILVGLILFINEFPDYEADRAVNKNTVVVLLGKEKAMILFNIFLWMVYIIIALCAIFRSLPWLSLITFLTIQAAFKIMGISKKNFDKVNELLPANAGTIGLHTMVGFLMSASFLLKAFF